MPRPGKEAKRGLLVVRTLAGVLVLSATFVGALVGGTLLHANVLPARRWLAGFLSDVLSDVFLGRVVIEHIDHVDANGFVGASVIVYDPAGVRVLTVSRLAGRASLFEIAKHLLGSARDVEIDIARARAEHVEALILPDSEGVPSLARAFTPRQSASPSAPSSNSKRIRVWLPEIALVRASLRGNIAGTGDLELDLANVRGAVLAGEERTSIHVRRFGVRAGGLAEKPAQGIAELRLEMPSATGKDISVWGTFDGNVGDVQANVRMGLDGRELKLVVEAPRARPEAVRALLPWWPIQDDVKLRVQAHGEPSHLFAQGSASIGAGVVEFAGDLGLGNEIHTNLAVEARDVELRSLFPDAPRAILSTSATVDLTLDADQGLRGAIDALSEPFTVAGFDVPVAQIAAKIEGPRVSGKAYLRAPTWPSQLAFDVHPTPNDGPVSVDLDWNARVPAIERVPWLAGVGRGAAAWRAKGTITEGRIQAAIDANVTHFERSGLALDEAHVTGTIRGPLATPTIDASLEGQRFAVGPLRFPELRARVEGGFDRLSVGAAVSGEDAAKLGVKGLIERRGGSTVVRDVEIAAARDDLAVFGKVGHILASGESVALRDISVEGLGGPVAGSLSISPSRVASHLSARGVDLKKVGVLFLPGAALEGHLDVDVDAEVDGKKERAHARVHLQKGGLGEISLVDVRAEADLNDGELSGGVDVAWQNMGTVTATTNGAKLAGSALDVSSWENALGRLQVDAGVDLARVKKNLGPLLGGLPDAVGALRSRIVLSREQQRETVAKQNGSRRAVTPAPDLDFLLWSDGLRVGSARDARGDGDAKGDKEDGDAKADDVTRVDRAASPFAIEGTDVQLALHLEGDGGPGQLTTRLVDREGIFATLTVGAEIGVADLWRERNTLGSRLVALPLRAELALPSRNLAVYPSFLRLASLRGEIEGSGVLTGTLRAPKVALRVGGRGVDIGEGDLSAPVDVDAEGHYDGEKGLVRLRARRPEGVVFDAATQIDAPIEKLLSRIARSSDAPDDKWWQATGGARLYQLPLRTVPALSSNITGGFATGTLTFRGLNREPVVEAKIEATNLTLGTANFPSAVAELRVAQGRAVLSARLEQQQGGASATASGSVGWPSPFLPEIDRRDPLDLYLEARDLRGAALHSVFLRGIFTYFDGRLNGTMHLHQEGEGSEIGESIDGQFELQDGRFQVPEIGQEFKNARAHLAVAKRGEVEITDVSANGQTGRFTATGKMAIKGFNFVSAEGNVRVAEKEAVPLTVEGVSLGDAWGTLMLHAKMSSERTIKLDIDVPSFHADLPESSSRAVQSLGDHPDIDVGIRRAGEKWTAVLLRAPEAKRADDALEWHVSFYLGQDVMLRRGSMMELALGGQPVVDITDKARVGGEVEFRSGRVEVFGKRFELEHGIAKFEGDDPSNPNVSVSARWDAPDGTRIYADFVGPLRTGLLSLRSEPARSQSDVIAVLLFGTADDSSRNMTRTFQQQKYVAADTGAVLAGGAISTSVNRVLSSVSPLDITTRVTSGTQSPTPEVAIRLSPRVTAQVSYRTRAPLATEKTDRVLVTFDWNFRRNWSVATSLGDKGGSVMDLIWRYRY